MSDDQPPPSTGASIDTAVAAVVRWVTRTEVRRSMLSSDERDLTRTDAWLLDRIQIAGPLRLSQLAAWQAVDKSTMTAQVRRLEQRGLIARSPDPADGRATLVSVTPAGHAVNDRNRAAARAVFDQIVEDWSEEDRAALSTLLNRFAEALAEHPPMAPARGVAGGERTKS